jgi:hypothetical protein
VVSSQVGLGVEGMGRLWRAMLVAILGTMGTMGVGSSTSAASDPTPAWTQQSPNVSPSARDAATMTYDAATGDTVLFGGETVLNGPDLNEYLNDTWVWNGATWAEQFPATSPSARAGASMATARSRYTKRASASVMKAERTG